MKTALILLLGLAVLGVIAIQAYNRFAPIDPGSWHVEVRLPEPGPGDWPVAGGHRAAVAVPGDGREALARLDAAISADPSARRLAGSVDEGRITYVTYTDTMKFRDFSTFEVKLHSDGALIAVFARAEVQQIGGHDGGTNRVRLERWFSEADLTP